MKTSSNNNNIESKNRVNNSRKQIKAEPKVGSREWYREKLTGEWERETMYFEYFDVHHDSCVEVHKPTHDGSPTGDRWQTDITVWGADGMGNGLYGGRLREADEPLRGERRGLRHRGT